MNPYANAFRVILGRYKDDFQHGEDRFEREDGPTAEADDAAEADTLEFPSNVELKEVA